MRTCERERQTGRGAPEAVSPGLRRKDRPAAHFLPPQAGSREAAGAGGSTRSWGPQVQSRRARRLQRRLGSSGLPDSRVALPAPIPPLPGRTGPDSPPRCVPPSRPRARVPPAAASAPGLRHWGRGSRQSRRRTKPPGRPPPPRRAARSPLVGEPAQPCARVRPVPHRLQPACSAPRPPAREPGARPPALCPRAPYPPPRPGTGVLGAAAPRSRVPARPGAPQARAHSVPRARPRRQLLAAVAALPPPRDFFFFPLAPLLPLEFFFFFTCSLQLPLVIGA